MKFAFLKSHHYFQIAFALAFITLLALLLAQCPTLAQSRQPVPLEGFGAEVPNLMEAREGIYTGGQPTEEGLRRLASFGIKTVINLRPPEESGARDESPEVKALGMNYVNIPVTSGSFTLMKMEDFRCLMKEKKNFPMFVHCGSGNRAGGTWFVYRVLFEGASIQQGLLEGRAIGMEPGLEPALIQFLQNAKQEKPGEVCQNQ